MHAGACNETVDACEPQPANEGEACLSGTTCIANETCSGGVCGNGTLLPPEDCFSPRIFVLNSGDDSMSILRVSDMTVEGSVPTGTLPAAIAVHPSGSAAYVTNKREPYYQWLYGDNISLGPVGQAKLKAVPICRFIGKRKAREAQVASDMPLYEATWAPESIQFYNLKPASFDSKPGYEFNRELRKVGVGHETDRRKLFLK